MVGAANQSPSPERDPARESLAAPVVTPQSLSLLVAAAASAPSGDNCQPWRFRWDGHALRIVFDADRAESFYDVGHAASWVSLGAVLENLDQAAAGLGLQPAVALWPDERTRDLAARIIFTAREPVASALAAAIPLRCVNRRPYRRGKLPNALAEELLAAGRGVPGVRTRLVEGTRDISRLARLAALNDRILFEHRSLHAGLQRWLRWTREETLRTRDGMPIETLELARVERPGFRLLSKWTFARLLAMAGGTRLLPARARRTYARSAALGLVTADGESAEAWVRAGRAVERIWLTAASREIAFQPITGITFLLLRMRRAEREALAPAHRRLLAGIGGQLEEMLQLRSAECPVMLFRAGLAGPPSARALRLPVADLLTIERSSPPSSDTAG